MTRPDWVDDPGLAGLARALASAGAPLLYTGGAVRDALAGGAWPADVDAVALCPSETGRGILQALGIRHEPHPFRDDVAFVRLAEGGIDEVSLGFVGAGEDALALDARRRDFTCNAVYLAPDGALVDPLGGAGDIARKVLRLAAPGAMADDPVRILRRPRIQRVLGGSAAQGIAEAERAASAGLAGCPPLRVVRELAKLLDLTTAAEAARDVAELAHSGALAAVYPDADVPGFVSYCRMCEERGWEEASESFPRLAVLGRAVGGGYDGRVARWGDRRDGRLSLYARFVDGGADDPAGDPVLVALQAHGLAMRVRNGDGPRSGT